MEPPSKKPRIDSAELAASEATDPIAAFDAHGDVEVIVEDEAIRVHSGHLGSASPVFAVMLTTRMREGISHRIELPGKSKEEFKLFMSFLRPLSRVRVTAETVDQMLVWFDEYQIIVLKEESEALLLTLPVTVDRLLQGRKYHLLKLYDECLRKLAPSQFIENLRRLMEEKEVFKQLLPSMQQKRPEWSATMGLIDKVLESDHFGSMVDSSVVALCLENSQYIDEAFAVELKELLCDSNCTAHCVNATRTLLKRLFACQRKHSENVQTGLVQLATDVYNEMPSRNNADEKARKMIEAFAKTLS
jgi:hypothetical protein